MSSADLSVRYSATTLIAFAAQLFERAGLSANRAEVLASIFLEADLLGFSTHGMQRVPSNLQWLQSGESAANGDHQVLVDLPCLFSWDARMLPGPWICSVAIDAAIEKAQSQGVAVGVLRRSQHAACLAAYLPEILENNLVGILIASTPAEGNVCAHGGIDPVFSPNPFAMAIPAPDEPVLFDISLSVTAFGKVTRALREGVPLPENCLKNRQGNVSNDPATMFTEPPGAILPIGGITHGYKGFALNIMSEVLTMALSGYGRSNVNAGEPEANSLFILVLDPEKFGTLASFEQEVAFLRKLCEDSQVRDGDPAVRMPGSRAWSLRTEQLKNGVELYPSIIEDIAPWAERLGVALPTPI